MKRDQITVPLPPGWGVTVSQAAADNGETVSEFVRSALRDALSHDGKGFMPDMRKAGRPVRRLRQGQSVDWSKP